MTKLGIYDGLSSDIRYPWDLPPLPDGLVMIKVTYLPLFVTLLFRGMPGMWNDRHRLILGSLVVMQALFPGHKTLAELARWTPSQITAWRFRRLLNAAYWDVHVLVEWWTQEALNTLPPPQDGILYVGGDGSEKPTRGKKNSLAQKGRKGTHKPWLFAVRFALLIVNWDNYRLPVACRLIRPKSHPHTARRMTSFVTWSRALCHRFGLIPSWSKAMPVRAPKTI